jgi:hypothetical protein
MKVFVIVVRVLTNIRICQLIILAETHGDPHKLSVIFVRFLTNIRICQQILLTET